MLAEANGISVEYRGAIQEAVERVAADRDAALRI